jgi:hypothetical protein
MLIEKLLFSGQLLINVIVYSDELYIQWVIYPYMDLLSDQ